MRDLSIYVSWLGGKFVMQQVLVETIQVLRRKPVYIP